MKKYLYLLIAALMGLGLSFSATASLNDGATFIESEASTLFSSTQSSSPMIVAGDGGMGGGNGGMGGGQGGGQGNNDNNNDDDDDNDNDRGDRDD